jgi:type IV secretory pathway VirB2 component (pilin)
MKKNIITMCVLMVLGMMAVIPMWAHGWDASNTLSPQPTIPNPFNCGSQSSTGAPCDLTTFITTVLNSVVMPLAAMVAVVFIIWAGFSYVTAQGNLAKLKEAHARLLWALIGTGILLGAAGISQVIQATVKSLTATT